MSRDVAVCCKGHGRALRREQTGRVLRLRAAAPSDDGGGERQAEDDEGGGQRRPQPGVPAVGARHHLVGRDQQRCAERRADALPGLQRSAGRPPSGAGPRRASG